MFRDVPLTVTWSPSEGFDLFRGEVLAHAQEPDGVTVAARVDGGVGGQLGHQTGLHRAVLQPDGRVALSQRLTTALTAAISPRLLPDAGRASTKACDAYTPVSEDVVVEVVAGTTRHAVVFPVELLCSGSWSDAGALEAGGFAGERRERLLLDGEVARCGVRTMCASADNAAIPTPGPPLY